MLSKGSQLVGAALLLESQAVHTEAMQAAPQSRPALTGPCRALSLSAAAHAQGPQRQCCWGPVPADLECGPRGFPEPVAVKPGVRGGLQAASGLLGGRDLRQRCHTPQGPGPAALLQQPLSPDRTPPPSIPPPRRLTWGQGTSCPAAPTWPGCAPGWARARLFPDGPASGARRFAGTPSQVRECSGCGAPLWGGGSLQLPDRSPGSTLRIPPAFCAPPRPPAHMTLQGRPASGSLWATFLPGDHQTVVTWALWAAVFSGELQHEQAKHCSYVRSPNPETRPCPHFHRGREGSQSSL